MWVAVGVDGGLARAMDRQEQLSSRWAEGTGGAERVQHTPEAGFDAFPGTRVTRSLHG